MDWLDEKFEKLNRWIRNLSLKKALFIFILICTVIVIALSAVTIALSEQWDSYIWSRYYEVDGDVPYTIVVYHDYSKLTRRDRVLVEIIDFLQSWSIFIYSLIGILGLSYLFYNQKVKVPLEILKEATDEVGNNNLDFELYYDNKDEMGDLCKSFDLMRKQLLANNLKTWDIIEEQKRLNAAFAHDLRTPLTVLRGYTDFLRQYVPEGKISEEKLLNTLTLMSDHINRLEKYSNTMKEINSLEELQVHRTFVEAKQLVFKIDEVINVLQGKNGITIKRINEISSDKVAMLLDETILMEVFENLISNALRYARLEIEVIISTSEEEQKLLLSIADDGKGFSNTDFMMATKAYYTDSTNRQTDHYGIGLYVCKLLLEKHRGEIILENRLKKGAIITAVFGIT